jgi:hypothetical protein
MRINEYLSDDDTVRIENKAMYPLTQFRISRIQLEINNDAS